MMIVSNDRMRMMEVMNEIIGFEKTKNESRRKHNCMNDFIHNYHQHIFCEEIRIEFVNNE